MSPGAETQRPLRTTGKRHGCAGQGRDARWGRELRYQPRCKQSAEQRRMRQRGPSHPPGAESQELPGDAAAGGGRAVRRAREHRARLCTDRLGWPSAGESVRAPRPRQGRRARVWAAPRLWSRTLPAPRTPSPEPAARAGGGAEAAHGHSAARCPPTRPGVRPAAVGDGWRRGGAGADGDLALALALAPREGGVEARPAAGAAITVWAAEFSWCLSGRCDNGVRPRERSSRSAQARRAPPRALRPALSAGSLGSGLEGGARRTRGGACPGRL